jgi:hypothetical protein
MIAVDIAEFTRPDRDNEIQLHMRTVLYALLRAACTDAGLPWDQCQPEDRGDGALIIFSPGIPAQPIIDPFLDRLRGLIRWHNRMSCQAARMQLRVAANIGPVYRDDHGFGGGDVTLLFRMLDARPLRRALSESGAELAFIVSDYMYDSLVRHHLSLVDPALFRSLKTQVKRTRVNAWIYLPGQAPPRPPARQGRQARLRSVGHVGGSKRPSTAVQPPSTNSTLPVTKEAASDAR